MIARKQGPLIVDDLKAPPALTSSEDPHDEDDGDITTPKSDPPEEDDKPLE